MDVLLLEHLFIGPEATNPDRYGHLNVLFPQYEKEMTRNGANHWVLWGKSKLTCPDGYSYSQFSYHLQ